MDESLKLTTKPIHAGFPNAADEAVLNKLNIHKLLIKSPSSTYFMRLDGVLGAKSYIPSRTLLIVDRSLKLRSGDIVVSVIRGEMVLKIYKVILSRHWLVSVDGSARNVEITDEDADILIWGVVIHTVESMRDV